MTGLLDRLSFFAALRGVYGFRRLLAKKPDDHYIPQNVTQSDSHRSPLGEYLLTVSNYSTRKGCWNYSRGEVFGVGSDNAAVKIADVKRNYSHFPFAWIDPHKNGHSYLICGENYQGQSVVELDTGRRRDHLSEWAEKGFGFCWSAYEYEPNSQLMIVDGCIWAGPYEFRFYDFSDPINGWPQLEVEEPIWAENKRPTFHADGTIKCYRTRRFYKPLQKHDDDITMADLDSLDDGAYDNESNWSITEDAITTFRREGSKLVVVDKWVSEAERERRKKDAEDEAVHEQWEKEFKSSDPLYLKYKEFVNKMALPWGFGSESYGRTHPGWCPTFAENEMRWCRRIADNQKKAKSWIPWSPRYTIDLEWAVKTGPIKVEVYKNGQKPTAVFFEHSAEGMTKAFEYTQSVLR